MDFYPICFFCYILYLLSIATHQITPKLSYLKQQTSIILQLLTVAVGQELAMAQLGPLHHGLSKPAAKVLMVSSDG